MKRLLNNNYCYSRKHNFCTIKKASTLDCFFEDKESKNIEQEYGGIFSGNRIKYEFANTHQLLFETTNDCNLNCDIY
jgi:hypothetical protein